MNKVLYVGGNYIKPVDGKEPEFAIYCNQWFVDGFRWIKSKKQWSNKAVTKWFSSFEWIDECEIGK